MTEATTQLAAFIERQYATQVVNLHPLAQGWKEVYRVERADGADLGRARLSTTKR